MMKRLLFPVLLTLTLLFNFSFASAQIEADPDIITFVAYWHKGEVRNYEITKVRKKWENGLIDQVDSITYMAKFEVIDSTEKSYTIKWTHENYLFKQYHLSQKSIEKLSEYKNIEVIYKTDELGAFVEVENWKEISEMTKKVFDELLQSKKGSERSKLKLKLQAIMMAYETKEGIEQIFFKELHVFHTPLGGQFDSSKPLEYEEKLPNLLSGGFLRGDGKLTFTHVNKEDEFCVFEQELKLNGKDAKKMVLDFLEKMNLPEKELKTSIKKSSMNIEDFANYQYFYGYGLPLEIETRREIEMKLQNQDAKQIDAIFIKLIFDEEEEE